MNNHHHHLWRSLNNSALLRFLLLFACGWVVIQVIAYFYSVIAIFTTAAILAVLMDYPVRQLARFMPRGVAITIVVLGTIVLMISCITLLGLQILTQGTGLLNTITTTIQSSNLPFSKFLEQINFGQIAQVLQSGLGTGLGLLGTLFSNTFTGIFLLVIAVYMLVEGQKLWIACLSIVPESMRDRFNYCVKENFLGFLRAQVTLILFLSSFSFLAFTLLGVQFSLVLALVVGVLDAIPGIGATLGVITITALVFLAQGPWIALKVLASSIVLQQIQDNYVHPKVMRDALKINPVLLFFALFVGERVAGLLGVFLAIPITGIIVSWSRYECKPKAALPAAIDPINQISPHPPNSASTGEEREPK